MTPQLAAGCIEDTLLDPHAANNAVPGQAIRRASGLLGRLAKARSTATRPGPTIRPCSSPRGSIRAQVFYQHNPASQHHGVNQGIYNLWGQVPVPNLSGHPVAYYNLTAAGATHSGNYGVSLWYRNFVAPTLGDQAPLIQSLRLEGQHRPVPRCLPRGEHPARRRVRESLGPGAARGGLPCGVLRHRRARLDGPRLPRAGGKPLRRSPPPGRPRPMPAGVWTLTTRPLHERPLSGRRHGVFPPSSRTRPGLTIVPMVPLGSFSVQARRAPEIGSA